MTDRKDGEAGYTPPQEKTAEESTEITRGDIRRARTIELMDRMVGRMLHSLRGTPKKLQEKRREIEETLADFVSQFVDIEMENQEQQEKSYLNPLTNVLNKKGAERIFELLKMEQVKKTGEGKLVVVRLDLDNFKKVNDLGGHNLGDRVLKAVAEKLRETDILIHFSGDEFGLILPNVKPYGDKDGQPLSLDDTIKNILTRVVQKIEEVNEDILRKQVALGGVSVTASMGYKSIDSKDLEQTNFSTADSLADIASAISKELKGTKRPATQRIVGAKEDRKSILENLGLTVGSLAASKLMAQIGRPVQDARNNLLPEAQIELDKKIEEIRTLIEQGYKPST